MTPRAFYILILACLVLVVLVGVGREANDAAAQATRPVTAFEGVVTDPDGTPIRGALVTDGEAAVVTGTDGLFALTPTNTAGDAALLIRAAGYADWRTPVAKAPRSALDVVLEPQEIRALYLNPDVTHTAAQVDRLIGIIDQTNANAVVIDIKEEWIWYETSVTFFRDAGIVVPVLDLPTLLRHFREHGIYTIARLTVFKDSLVAEAYPEYAIRNAATGRPWRDVNGVAWVNPMERALWDPNIDLAYEAATLGFDEIQYDYIRFPTDGDLSTMDFGAEYTQEGRQAAIEGFLARSRERLLPTGVRQSADVFGFSMVVDDDVGIGQNFARLAEYVDYLSPMVYPSHYSDGQFGLPGHPNDFPYEVVSISLESGIAKVDGNGLLVRPWLQAFSLAGMRPYGTDDIVAQIRAADEAGTSGWMLWDPENRFDTAPLEPEVPAATPRVDIQLPPDPASLRARRVRR